MTGDDGKVYLQPGTCTMKMKLKGAVEKGRAGRQCLLNRSIA